MQSSSLLDFPANNYFVDKGRAKGLFGFTLSHPVASGLVAALYDAAGPGRDSCGLVVTPEGWLLDPSR